MGAELGSKAETGSGTESSQAEQWSQVRFKKSCQPSRVLEAELCLEDVLGHADD